jgi:hypothetical protein
VHRMYDALGNEQNSPLTGHLSIKNGMVCW